MGSQLSLSTPLLSEITHAFPNPCMAMAVESTISARSEPTDAKNSDSTVEIEFWGWGGRTGNMWEVAVCKKKWGYYKDYIKVPVMLLTGPLRALYVVGNDGSVNADICTYYVDTHY